MRLTPLKTRYPKASTQLYLRETTHLTQVRTQNLVDCELSNLLYFLLRYVQWVTKVMPHEKHSGSWLIWPTVHIDSRSDQARKMTWPHSTVQCALGRMTQPQGHCRTWLRATWPVVTRLFVVGGLPKPTKVGPSTNRTTTKLWSLCISKSNSPAKCSDCDGSSPWPMAHGSCGPIGPRGPCLRGGYTRVMTN